MSRFYIPRESVIGNKITVSGKEAHHMIDVMRLKISDEVSAFDGEGAEYNGRIEKIGNKEVVIAVTSVTKQAGDNTVKLTLIQAVPKKEKMDYIVEKATELGASSIIPVFTDRVIPDWDESKKSKHFERWKNIAKEAAKQCGRLDVPSISPVSSFSEAIDNSRGCRLKIIAALNTDSVSLKDAMKEAGRGSIAVAIGPEGDFTVEEVNYAKKAGFKTVTLGARVLKSDTAGLAVLAILNHEYSD